MGHRSSPLGRSNSALVTFAGQGLPHYMAYYGSHQRVTPYRPLKRVCTTCVKKGHRADVCTTPGTQAFPRCTSTTLAPDHACVFKCLLCDGDHSAADKVCQHRYTDRRPSQQGAGRWSRNRGRSRKPPTEISPAMADRSESRGRSRTPCGRSRSKTRSRSRTTEGVGWASMLKGHRSPPKTHPPPPPNPTETTDWAKDFMSFMREKTRLQETMAR
ncbi:hypothetical protein IscW_ISCW005149 [Ixodes scapularis]|uniref:Uncharacterized protein n=1 Tax=Ixodes scapularis TaxID=6945 RepID=B7PHW8_IXOSC|nr:hypothetical protein IscW_ISCW005149 [Ixodes scapularis]|eukprot:XP_002403726.1 hypothetical protein IscW_ISCW005149 [Ixodes scapularis]